jgi:hypothetical protein
MTNGIVRIVTVAAMVLGGGMLLAGDGCTPDNFFVDLGTVAAQTAVSEFVAAIVALFVPA